jgi:2-hydroxy-6-oxonona-2,4-dienedioate hydrolase
MRRLRGVAVRYTAEHVPGARFIGYPSGGHMLVGHEAEFDREVLGFLDALGTSVPDDIRSTR